MKDIIAVLVFVAIMITCITVVLNCQNNSKSKYAGVTYGYDQRQIEKVHQARMK